MKNKKLIFLLSALAITSCGGNTSSNSQSGGVESGTSIDHTNDYATRVVLPNGTPVEGIRVRYCYESQCARPIATDSDGYAYFTPDPNVSLYDVHLILGDLEQNYTYNPNIYTVSNENKITTITLSNLSNYENGDGTMYASGSDLGPYAVNEGAYRISLNADEVKYVSFAPKKPGVYNIESWIENGSLPEIDPFVELYGNSPYIHDCYEGNDDFEGNGKNFKFEFEISDDFFEEEVEVDDEGNYSLKLDENGNRILRVDENGNNIPKSRYTFQLGAKQAATYDYSISYVREYVNPYTPIEEAPVTAELSKYPNYPYGLYDCDINGDTLVKSSTDGYYHVNTVDGPIALARIKSTTSYSFTSFFDLLGGPGESSLIVENGTKSYKNFVLEYSHYVNSDGVYPLNDELVTFIKAFAEANVYFDGDNGFISSYFQYSGDYYDVLWDCSYYVVDGTIDNPRAIDLDDSNNNVTCSLSEGEEIYYSVGSKTAIGEVTFTPDENTVLTYDSNSYTSTNPLILDVTAMSYFVFKAKTSNGLEGEISFTFELPDAGNQLVEGLNTVEASYTGVEYSFTNTGFDTATFRLTTYDDNAYIDFFDGNAIEVNGESHFRDFELEPNESVSINVCCNDSEYPIVNFYVGKIATKFDDYAAFLTASCYILVPSKTADYAFYADQFTFIEVYINGNTESYDSVNNGYVVKSLNENDEAIVLVYASDYTEDTVLCLSYASLVLTEGDNSLVIPTTGLNVCYVATSDTNVSISINDSCYFAVIGSDGYPVGYFGKSEENATYTVALTPNDIVNIVVYSYDFEATSTNCTITIA